MAGLQVGFLGPIGTYSHLVAEKRFGTKVGLVPQESILDVCAFVARDPARRRGVIPIENSSGGAIYETIDILLEHKPRVHVCEELSLEVRLALLGHSGEKIRTLYSHFAPLEHCETWLRKHLPRVKKHIVSSTAVAAEMAARDPNAASLGSRRLAGLYGVSVLKFPVQADIPNLTVFIVVGGTERVIPTASKTTFAVYLPNTPGALCTFLETFRYHDVNLSRLISRPIRGCPRQYAFLVDVEGASASPKVERAFVVAKKTCVKLRIVGSYPARQPYKS